MNKFPYVYAITTFITALAYSTVLFHGQAALLNSLPSPPKKLCSINTEALTCHLTSSLNELTKKGRDQYSVEEQIAEIEDLHIKKALSSELPQQDLKMEFSFYTAECKGCTGYTRWGEYDVRHTIYYEGMRIVATDPELIPPFSIIEFELEGTTEQAIALDTGGAIKGNRIDLLVKTKQEAITLGLQNIEITILRFGQGGQVYQ